MARKPRTTLTDKMPAQEVIVTKAADGSMMLGLSQVMVGADLMVRLEVLDSVLRMGPHVALRVAEALRRHAIPLITATGSSPSAAVN